MRMGVFQQRPVSVWTAKTCFFGIARMGKREGGKEETGTAGKMHYLRYPASDLERDRSITASFFGVYRGTKELQHLFLPGRALLVAWGLGMRGPEVWRTGRWRRWGAGMLNEGSWGKAGFSREPVQYPCCLDEGRANYGKAG